MSPKFTLIMISLISQSLLLIGMQNSPLTITTLSDNNTATYQYWFPEKNFISFTETGSDKLNEHFHNNFGYDIPELLIKETIDNKSVYKAVPKNYLTHNNPLATIEIQDICYPLPLKNTALTISAEHNNPMEDIIQNFEGLTLLTQQKNQLEKIIKEKTLILKETLALHTQLTQEIDQAQVRNKEIKKEISSKKQSVQQKTAINARKKKAANHKCAGTPNKKNSSSILISPAAFPKHNPNRNHTQQKLYAIRYLMKSSTVQTPEQLKTKFYKRCKNNDINILRGRINRYCTWKYIAYENELIINTDNRQASSSDEDSSTQESSDDYYYSD